MAVNATKDAQIRFKLESNFIFGLKEKEVGELTVQLFDFSSSECCTDREKMVYVEFTI